MTYRGVVSKGIVLFEGDGPAEGTLVEVTPVNASTSSNAGRAVHPAMGIWKDRTDLPDDAVQASKVLRRELMGRGDE